MHPPSHQPLSFDEFAKLYCETQQMEPDILKGMLQAQRYVGKPPDGWMLLECHDMSSSKMGSRVILAYGPHNTYKSPPTHPISPLGLASDMSVVIALLPYSNLI